ncbi:LysR substrate-binding domain-containing protein [Shewanella youngdeokensis]|uniref:LysR substrate-binding domain-containing protein n=1 Tax=Shewanella youngdeokensis TaxID=2999068 RepID=UPI004046C9CC
MQQTHELANHNIVGFSGAKVLNDWPLKGGYTVKPTLSSSNGETVRQLTLAGNGIACLSGFMVKNNIENGSLVTLLQTEKINKSERELINAVYYKSSSVAKRISAFIDYIQPKLVL